MVEASVRHNWDRPALRNYGQTPMTYGELAVKIAELHILFESCGVKKGEKIAICSKNQANWAVVMLAVMTYGAVAVPILHEFKPANIRHLLAHSEAKLFFVGDVIWDRMT